MMFLGCDPDMHSMAFAVVNEHMAIMAVALRTVPSSFKEQDATLEMVRVLYAKPLPWVGIFAGAVESQELYLSGPNRTQNPRSILHLGHVAGAAAMAIVIQSVRTLYFPTPAEWKGSREKLAHHHHILQRTKQIPSEAVREMGGKEPYCTIDTKLFPIPGAEALNPGDWKHVLDAVGLAQYAAEKYLYEDRKARLLSAVRG